MVLPVAASPVAEWHLLLSLEHLPAAPLLCHSIPQAHALADAHGECSVRSRG